MNARIEELARFIETFIARFKEDEGVFESRLEVSHRELALLRTLATEGPMISKELGARFQVPLSTMTGLIDRMENKGLVRRTPSRRDRRSIELEVTPAGGLILEEQRRGLQALARGILESLPKADQQTLLEILRRIPAAGEDTDRKAG